MLNYFMDVEYQDGMLDKVETNILTNFLFLFK